jgi:hypothetical protein
MRPAENPALMDLGVAAAPAVRRGTRQGGTKIGTFEKGGVRIYFEEAGSGFPLLVIGGGGLNSISGLAGSGSPFNPMQEFKAEYRCIAYHLRNAKGGASLRGFDGSRDAGAEGRSQHVPLEAAEGADSAGDPPDPIPPAGAPADSIGRVSIKTETFAFAGQTFFMLLKFRAYQSAASFGPSLAADDQCAWLARAARRARYDPI